MPTIKLYIDKDLEIALNAVRDDAVRIDGDNPEDFTFQNMIEGAIYIWLEDMLLKIKEKALQEEAQWY